MTDTHSEGLTLVRVEDVLDWAYCPLRYLWRNDSTMRDIADPSRRKAGEYLMRQSVMSSLRRYYAILEKLGGKKSDITLADVHNSVWRLLLDRWKLSSLQGPLNEYARMRRSLEMTYSARGNQRKADGSQCKRPSASPTWRDQVKNNGMLDLQRAIDNNQRQAGLAVLPLPDDEFYIAPMGLADAFAISSLIVEKMQNDLPDQNNVQGIDVPVYVNLLSVRLQVNVDILVDHGTAPNRPGRPKADGESTQRRYFQFHCFSYEESTPSIYDLAKNIRLMALRQSLPVGVGKEEPVLEDVVLRHLRSGESETFSANPGENVDVLESLARAFVNGNRSGSIVPRMVHSWMACQDCEYRALCYDGNGVMETFNPPLMAQIQAGQETTKQLLSMVQNVPGQKPEEVINALQAFATWMNSSPGLSPEGVLWMLDSIKAELE